MRNNGGVMSLGALRCKERGPNELVVFRQQPKTRPEQRWGGSQNLPAITSKGRKEL